MTNQGLSAIRKALGETPEGESILLRNFPAALDAFAMGLPTLKWKSCVRYP